MPSARPRLEAGACVAGPAPAPQLTLKAILLSIVLTVILASANAYVGLFAGLTVATAIPAAVISMAVLPLFGRPNILENNIVATGASAGSSISAGAIFTLPALILLHHWTSFDYWWALRHRRPRRPARRAVLGAAAPHADHRAEAAVPRGCGRRRGAEGGRQPRRRREISRLRGPRRRRVQAGHLGTALAARDVHRRRASSASAASPSSATASRRRCSRVGYIVGLNVAILIAAGGLFSWWLAIPLYNSLLLRARPRARRTS